MPFLYCISSFEGTSYKICNIQPLGLLALVFHFNSFKLADIIFHKILELF